MLQGSYFARQLITRGIKITPPLRSEPTQSQNGVLFFPEISAISKRGFIFSRNLSNLSIFFQKISPILCHFLDPFWTPFWAFSPCKTPKIPQKNSRASRAGFIFPAISNPGFIFSRNLSNLRFGVLFFPEISPMFQIRVLLRGGGNFISLVHGGIAWL